MKWVLDHSLLRSLCSLLLLGLVLLGTLSVCCDHAHACDAAGWPTKAACVCACPCHILVTLSEEIPPHTSFFHDSEPCLIANEFALTSAFVGDIEKPPEI